MKTLIKKSITLALAFAAVLSLSCCGVGDEALIDETTTETTTTTTETTIEETTEETTTGTLSEEELDKLAQNMPEIVFVLSFEDVYNENIYGFYVLNTGKIKIYDFRKIAPDEIYSIPDVYDRLEEATCERLEPKIDHDSDFYEDMLVTEDELITLSQDELTEYYKRLLLIDGDAGYVGWGGVSFGGELGYYKFYGIKNNGHGKKECVLLSGYGDDSEYEHSNSDATKMYVEFQSFLPDLQYIDYQ